MTTGSHLTWSHVQLTHMIKCSDAGKCSSICLLLLFVFVMVFLMIQSWIIWSLETKTLLVLSTFVGMPFSHLALFVSWVLAFWHWRLWLACCRESLGPGCCGTFSLEVTRCQDMISFKWASKGFVNWLCFEGLDLFSENACSHLCLELLVFRPRLHMSHAPRVFCHSCFALSAMPRRPHLGPYGTEADPRFPPIRIEFGACRDPDPTKIRYFPEAGLVKSCHLKSGDTICVWICTHCIFGFGNALVWNWCLIARSCLKTDAGS